MKVNKKEYAVTVKETAGKMLEGCEYHDKMDYVLPQLSGHLGVEPDALKVDLEKAIEEAQAARDKKRFQADPSKVDDAKRLREKAADARKFADEAEAEAKALEAAAVQAEAEAKGHVLVTVPAPFTLNLSLKERVTYQPGTQTMPMEHADHNYAVAMGVKKIGIPTAAPKA